jgi:hypothetical protein
MPDISMCKGTDCPKKEQCYRYTAEPDSHWQSYFTSPPTKDGECGYFWPDKIQAIPPITDGECEYSWPDKLHNSGAKGG